MVGGSGQLVAGPRGWGSLAGEGRGGEDRGAKGRMGEGTPSANGGGGFWVDLGRGVAEREGRWQDRRRGRQDRKAVLRGGRGSLGSWFG